MMRIWGLTGVALVVFLSGCGSDVKELTLNHELQMMEQTTAKLKTLKEKVDSATDKMVADKELDLSEAVKVCEELKKLCKDQVQKDALEIQSMRLTITPSEREAYKQKFENNVTNKVKVMNDEQKALDASIKKLESAVDTVNFTQDTKRDEAKKAIEDFKKKLSEANGEFESLNRRS